jgi:hypothetical protein
METVVRYGASFICPNCRATIRRVTVGRNLFVYTVPRGHEVGKDNQIVCFWTEQPVVWRVRFDRD